ncbi:uncharacterized protein LOC108631313 [Ceratina calcarata]|uniref:Uncharacterized protein LOC108631313 n=1 Tax=Ceratina calcarata TaxID=156304 RepID=A0AAJ7SBV1_9HYME|nr:uncharacterized protein LOC108631313 [Ceratina calcarata]
MLKFSLAVLIVTSASVSPQENDGVLDKIKAGLEYATNYLETAKDIANLVAKSLGKKRPEKDGHVNPEEKGNFGPPNIMSAFFRLFGLDSQKVTAIAVNSVIFLAQMISSLFDLKTKGNPGRSLEDDTSSWDPAKLITESKNEKIQRLISQAHDENLPRQLIEKVDGADSACVRLLICKTSPVIRAAQNFLKNKTQKLRRITSWLPSRDEFEENSDECENMHTDCSVLDKIKAGLEYATNYLETAKDIANLVAKSLGKKRPEKDGHVNPEEKGNFGPPNIMSAFFRLFGLDSQKVTAIAVNSVIFLAQMISSLFDLKTKGNPGRSLEDDTSSWDPAKLITESKNEKIQRLISQAHDENLPRQLIEKVDGADSACVRLLICKTSPVIRAAQNFLKNKTQKLRRITSWLPSRDEFEENSDECENMHTDCSLFT